MGYDLHITRAFLWYDSGRYPILGDEVDDLVRTEGDLMVPADAPRRSDFCFVGWGFGGDDWLLFRSGRLTTKNPRPELVRRMTELADRLDAWLIGEHGEVVAWEGDRAVSWQRGRDAFAGNPCFLTRGTSCSGMNDDAPIRRDAWLRFAAGQPDFVVTNSIEAMLPSGVRNIPCPPVACWTGHPYGRRVPFFHDVDVVEVRDADEPTMRRMAALAVGLDARAVNENDRPIADCAH